MRILHGVFAASATVVPAYLLLLALTGDLDNDLQGITVVVAFLVGLVGVTVIGLPTHFILSSARVRSVWPYVVVGFGVPAAACLAVAPFGQDGLLMVLWQAFLLGSFGALLAFVFWRVAVHEAKA